MKTSRKSLYWVSAMVVFFVVSLLIGFLVWRSWAIRNAIRACNPAYGFQPVEPPTHFHAELTTYEKAEPATSNLLAAEKPVWVIEMEGRWMLVGGLPADPDDPGPFYVDECTIIVDARTGESLSLIRQELAIQNAILSCDGIGLQPAEQPTQAEARLIWGGAEIPPYDSEPERPVWVVTMKGRWRLFGGPMQALDPSNPHYVDECVIKIDARTGVSVSAVIE